MNIIRVELSNDSDGNVIAAKIPTADARWNSKIVLQDGISCIAKVEGDNRRFMAFGGLTVLESIQKIDSDFKVGLIKSKKINLSLYAYKTHVDAMFGFGGNESLHVIGTDGDKFCVRGFGAYVYQVEDYEMLINKINSTKNGKLFDADYSDYIRDTFGLSNCIKEEIGKALNDKSFDNIQTKYSEIQKNAMDKLNREIGISLGIRIVKITIQNLVKIDG